MKKHLFKRISIILTALLLLFALSVPAMAAKGTGRKVATPSNMEDDFDDEDEDLEDGDDLDGEGLDDEGLDDGTGLSDSEEEEDDLVVSEGGEIEDELSDAEDGLTVEEELEPEADAAALTETETAAAAAQAALPKTGAALMAEDLAGTWTIDGITSYRFKADGTGALLLPEHKYPFSFTIEEDELTLEFNAAKIGKAVFTAAVDGDRLTLTREEEAGTAEFVLERTED
ncbi:MAG: hypothetical protein IJR62_01995 [Lachnospiraceae bacterium]|nr:hypothetical protein [Lachnospiraceae bacterium]